MYTVKQVAEKLEVSAETIRYYTRLGIVEPRRDPQNKYRYYSERDIYVIEFIRKAKYYGLTIHEIREVLERSHKGESPCPIVRELVTNRCQEIRKKIAELQALESRLKYALLEWEAIDDHLPNEYLICPLIENSFEYEPYTHEHASHAD